MKIASKSDDQWLNKINFLSENFSIALIRLSLYNSVDWAF